MTTSRARTVSVSVERDPAAVYDYICDPRNLPSWAPGFAKSVREEAGRWLVETEAGTVGIAFASDNPLGVVDHRVTDDQGLDDTNPMRVIPNGHGSEVLFTLFQSAGISDDQFQHDLGLVESDLQLLKRVLESGERWPDAPRPGSSAGK
ncbi:MAG TPA: SRPBCC family protein [Nocardioidaceae bacterium]|nr:SRPBCC family protein [Nocardioidaceae bacterium]